LAPASTITTPLSIPATTRSRSDCSRSSGVKNALNSPFTRPTRRPATGPSNGAPLIDNAALAAIIATISGRKAGSIDSTLATTCTSARYPFGNSGRMGRSIMRPIKIASSDGRPSRLIKRLPLILPAAYIFSS
jgi:hypothetical protein